jgi:hypothetical protein
MSNRTPTERRDAEQDHQDEAREARQDAADRRSSWHFVKEIPLTVILAIVIQTLAGLYSMGRFAQLLEGMQGQMAEFKAERYTREDARRDKELMQTLVSSLERTGQERDRRLGILEGYVDRQRGVAR